MGLDKTDHFVTEYKVQYLDSNGKYVDYTDGKSTKLFKGNSNANEVKEHVLKPQISKTKKFRILPTKVKGSKIGLRLELEGCEKLVLDQCK